MDDNEYRRLCSQPDVVRRADVRATVARLRPLRSELAERVAALLAATPVPKPIGHDGGPETDYLWLDLAEEEIADVVSTLGELEAALALDGAPAAQLSAVATLLDRWNAAESSRPAV